MGVETVVFASILAAAAWQDFKCRSIGRWFLLGSGIFGVVCSFLGGRTWQEVLVSCGIGGLLLGLCHLTGGGIGEGDGWFFVVSGMYLNWKENVMLLLSGLFLCFLWSMPLAVQAILRKGEGRKRGIPFLPFLIPGGIWLILT